MKNNNSGKGNILLNDSNLNNTFEEKTEKIKLKPNYFSSERKESFRNIPKKTNNLIKLNTLYKNPKKLRPQTSKKDYIISKNIYAFKGNSKLKNKTSLNNEFCTTDINNKNKKKLIESSKDDFVNNTYSRDKTFYYSVNNTFNNTNTKENSNLYMNTGGKINMFLPEKDISHLIKFNDGELNMTDNSFNKNQDIISNKISKAPIRNINNFRKLSNTKDLENNRTYSNKSVSSSKNKNISEYYSLKDEIMKIKKRRDNLINDSRKFYLYNNDRGIINKLKQIKYKNTEKEEKENGLNLFNEKFKLYSDIRRLPTKVSFNIGVSSTKNDLEDFKMFYKFNNDKFIKSLVKKKNKGTAEKKVEDYNKLIREGFPIKSDLKNYYLFDHKLIINSDKNRKYEKNKDVFGQDIYPLLNQKKILKNILPKEVDYNTQFSILDILNNEMHPLKRYQKRTLNHHSNLISQEINYVFCQNIKITDIPCPSNIYNPNNLLDYETNAKFNSLLKTLLKDEKKKFIDENLLTEDKKKIIHRKIILEKFKNQIKICYNNFKRLKISIHFFFQIIFHDKPTTYEDGLYIFNAVKDKDITEIENSVKNNYKLALFKDEFKQTALHICAKRNVYQVIQLFTSRLADIDAQDIYGRTPLMCAAQAGNMECLCVLLFTFADPGIEDKKGRKAIDYSNDHKIKYALQFSRVIHLFNKMYNNVKNFDQFVIGGLRHLFSKEIPINFEPWLAINDKIVKENNVM